MLKVFMVSQDVAAIEVEEKYTQWVEQLRTDRYVTAGILGDGLMQYPTHACHIVHACIFASAGHRLPVGENLRHKSGCTKLHRDIGERHSLIERLLALCKYACFKLDRGQQGTPHPQAGCHGQLGVLCDMSACIHVTRSKP